VTAGLALTNASGINTLTINTALAGGTGTVSDSNSLNAKSIVFGDNIDVVNVTSLASGTRDSVAVDITGSSKATITGSASGSDTYNISGADGSNVILATVGANDAVTITAGADFDMTGVATLEDLTINATAALDIDVTTALSEDTVVNAAGDVNIDLLGSAITGKGLTSTGAGAVTVSVSDSGATFDAKEVVAAIVEFDGAHAAADTKATVNQASLVNLDVDLIAAKDFNINIDNADGDLTTGALLLNISESQSTGAKDIITGAKVDTLVIQATPDEASDTLNGTEVTHISAGDITLNAATNVLSVIGDQDLTIASLVNNGDETISAVSMTGALTISNMANGASIYGGSGDDSIKSTTALTTGTFTVYGGAGDDTIDFDTTVDKASVIYGEDGDDTIYTSDKGDTVNGGAGDDTVVVKGTAATTITLGDGSDTVQMAAVADGHTIKDFVIGTDKLILTGTGKADLDLTEVAKPSSGAYDPDGSGDFNITLTGNSARDLSSSVQLGKLGTNFVASSGKTVVGGDFGDFIEGPLDAKATITLGAGADTFYVAVSGDNDDGTSTIKDFNIAEDKIVFSGKATKAVDLSAVQTDETYTLDKTFQVILTDVEETDITGFFALGDRKNTFTALADTVNVGGDLSDYV